MKTIKEFRRTKLEERSPNKRTNSALSTIEVEKAKQKSLSLFFENRNKKTTSKTVRSLCFSLCTFSLSLTGLGWAQNVGINSTGFAPHPSALLDIDAAPLCY